MSTEQTDAPAVRTAVGDGPAGPQRQAHADQAGRGRAWARLIGRGGVLIALVLVIAAFGIARPDSFLTVNSLNAILQQAAAPAILAIGLTVPLALGEFDLSIGSMVGLGGASAVALITLNGIPWPVAVLIALLIGLLVGTVNGTFVAYLGASSFVQTLAMGVILLGVEYLFTNQHPARCLA